VRDVRDVFDRLAVRYGPRHWWPAETRFEVIVGALLMAQTSWGKVVEAIGNLKRAGPLDAHALAAARIPTIRALVRPAGLYRQKPWRLKRFCQHLVRVADGDLDRFFARDLATLRVELLGLDGVGPETADSILLYAADFPTFVVDAYTVRIGRRIGWFATDRYDEVKAFFEARVPTDLETYREFHALLVAHGAMTCRPKPRCDACPVNDACDYARRNAAEKGATERAVPKEQGSRKT
jgi:endonuclease-3 related protein